MRAADPVRVAVVTVFSELHRLVIELAVCEASASTIWRWLHDDALKPWQTRSWIYRRDPEFQAKAARVLDLYARVFEGRRLRPNEYVVCAGENSQLQALGRRHETAAPARGRPIRYEFEYERGGTLACLAAWDVDHANLFDRVEQKTGIEPFGRLVEQVMTSEPYASAARVFWIVDHGSSHAGNASIERMQARWPTARPIHLPVHASWLNQIELYFSIAQRKALTPNDLPTRDALAERLIGFGEHYRQIARPFDWTFTRADLERVLERVDATPAQRRPSAHPARSLTPELRREHQAARRARHPTLTATASSRPARRNRRDPLPKSTSAAAASTRSITPASACAITARASRARSNGVSIFSTTISSSSESGSSSRTASAGRSSSDENTFGNSTCNDNSAAGSSHNSSNSSPSSESDRLRSLTAASRHA